MKTRLLLTFVFLAALLAACAPQAVQVANPTDLPKANPTAVPQVEPTAAPTAVPASGGSEVKVNISGFAFDPLTITIKAGDTVTWTNKDSATHNVAADDGSWTSPDLSQGASFSRTFDTPGTYPYNCGFHASMKGTVIVQ
jgi:plastocyanin